MYNRKNSNNNITLRCMTDVNLTLKLNSDSHHFSQNYLVADEISWELIKNNIISQDELSKSTHLLGAELAVFSGNLLKLILGNHQPNFYLYEISDFDKRKPEFTRFDHPYFVVSDHIDGYSDWEEAVRIKNEDIYVFNELTDTDKIHDSTSMLVAGHFVGELDWSGGNFGLVASDDEYFAVRIDPCISFTNAFFDRDPNLDTTLKNLLLGYVSRYNTDEENYFKDFIDYAKNRLTNKSLAKQLFCNLDETLETIKDIVAINDTMLAECAKQSFHPSHHKIADYLITVIKKRQEYYKQARSQILDASSELSESDDESLSASESQSDESSSLFSRSKRKRDVSSDADQASLESFDDDSSDEKPPSGKKRRL